MFKKYVPLFWNRCFQNIIYSCLWAQFVEDFYNSFWQKEPQVVWWTSRNSLSFPKVRVNLEGQILKIGKFQSWDLPKHFWILVFSRFWNGINNLKIGDLQSLKPEILLVSKLFEVAVIKLEIYIYGTVKSWFSNVGCPLKSFG